MYISPPSAPISTTVPPRRLGTSPQPCSWLALDGWPRRQYWPLKAAPDWSVLWVQNEEGKGQVSWLLETDVPVSLPTFC